MKRLNVLFINISISLISILFGVFIAEFFLNKLSKKETVWNSFEQYIKLEQHAPSIKKEVSPSNIYQRQADALDMKRKYYIQTDESGSIVNPQDKNTFYDDELLDIVFLGGSTTENMFISENMRFPALVTKKLNQIDYCGINSCRVLNSGASGRIIPASINVFLNRYLVLRPKKAVLMHNINDLNYLLLGNKYWQSERHIEYIYRYPLFKLNSYTRTLASVFPNLYGLFARTYLTYYEMRDGYFENEQKNLIKKIPIKVEENLTDRFIEVLDVFINICKINNIEPILMTQPSRFSDKTIEKLYVNFLPGVTFQEIERLHKKFNQIIRDYSYKGVRIIDLENSVPANNQYYLDAVHFSENGNKLAAEIIFDQLIKK